MLKHFKSKLYNKFNYSPIKTAFSSISNSSSGAKLSFDHYPSLKADSKLNILAFHGFLMNA